jgi:hypothetical protein
MLEEIRKIGYYAGNMILKECCPNCTKIAGYTQYIAMRQVTENSYRLTSVNVRR